MSTATRTRLPLTLETIPNPLPRMGREVKVQQRGRRPNYLTKNPDGTHSRVRPRTHEEEEMASQFQKVRAFLTSTDFWVAARPLPGNSISPGRSGRPPAHPSWVYLMVATTAAITGSQRSAIAFFQDPIMWGFIKDYANTHRPSGFDPAGANPPKRYHLTHFNRKWKQAEWATVRDNAKKSVLGVALNSAKAKGFLDPSQKLDFFAPDPGQHVSFDGTVFPAASQKRRSENPEENASCRFDSSAGMQLKNGTEHAWGTKYVFASIRSDDYQGREILDYEAVVGMTKTGIGDEAAVLRPMALRIKAQAPGMRGVISDSIIHGKDVEELAAADLVTTNYPIAAANPNRLTEGRNGPGRIGKAAKVVDYTHKLSSGGTCTHHISVQDTVYYQTSFNQEGKEVLIALAVDGSERRPNNDGTMRWYHKVSVPCRYGEQLLRIPVHHAPDKRGNMLNFNRGENLRFYPTNTPQFDILYGRRNDTESFHAQVKLPVRRMPAYGVVGQSLYMLGMVIAHNSLTHVQDLRLRGLPNSHDGTK